MDTVVSLGRLRGACEKARRGARGSRRRSRDRRSRDDRSRPGPDCAPVVHPPGSVRRFVGDRGRLRSGIPQRPISSSLREGGFPVERRRRSRRRDGDARHRAAEPSRYNSCSMTQRVVTAFAPATVSNVACGFDVLGFPMEEPGDTVSARLIDTPGVLIDDILNDGGRIPRDPEKNTASVAAKAMLDALGARCGVALTIRKGLPLASGLGGSAASAAAAVVAVDALIAAHAPVETLVACALEGERLGAGSAHADNIAPCICGGLVLVRRAYPPDLIRLPVPAGLTAVVVHPDL